MEHLQAKASPERSQETGIVGVRDGRGDSRVESREESLPRKKGGSTCSVLWDSLQDPWMKTRRRLGARQFQWNGRGGSRPESAWQRKNKCSQFFQAGLTGGLAGGRKIEWSRIYKNVWKTGSKLRKAYLCVHRHIHESIFKFIYLFSHIFVP